MQKKEKMRKMKKLKRHKNKHIRVATFATQVKKKGYGNI